MEQEILKRLEENEKKLEAIYVSVEKTRKYFMWTLIISLGFIIVPLIGLAFVIPKFLATLSLSTMGL